MDTNSTIESYRSYLIPFYQKIKKKIEDEVICEGDNARCHTSKQCRKFLKNHNISHELFAGYPINEDKGRPTNSPDLCPIEYVFSNWQERVLKRKPTTVSQLIKIATEEWANIPLSDIQKTYDLQWKVHNWVKKNNYQPYCP